MNGQKTDMPPHPTPPEREAQMFISLNLISSSEKRAKHEQRF